MHMGWHMVTMGVSVLAGAIAGLYFRVFILAPLTILALLGTAIVDVTNGLPLRITLFHMTFIWGGLQLAYLGSSFLASRPRREIRSRERENAPNNMYVGDSERAPRGRAIISAQGNRGRGVA